jgi:murein DD-endopeptidase MepM/ murein hydrolase activator NlpD
VRDFVKRSLNRVETNFFPKPPSGFDDVYNAKVVEAMQILQRANDIKPTGNMGVETFDLLWREYADAYAKWVYRIWRAPAPNPPPPLMVAPIAVGSIPSYLHPTAGLLGNYALDWMAVGGTPVYAVEPAKIKKLSGRDPNLGADQIVGIYGWSIHYETPAGYRYFSTHYGSRQASLYVGKVVEAGEKLGEIGWWPGDPGRSHLHLGVTSPLGIADAQKRIKAVAASPRPLLA